MWEYEKRLQYPVKIKKPDARAAKVILSQYGGPDGELGASLRYLSQRFAMPDPRVAGLLTDIGISVIHCAFNHLTTLFGFIAMKSKGTISKRRNCPLCY